MGDIVCNLGKKTEGISRFRALGNQTLVLLQLLLYTNHKQL